MIRVTVPPRPVTVVCCSFHRIGQYLVSGDYQSVPLKSNFLGDIFDVSSIFTLQIGVIYLHEFVVSPLRVRSCRLLTQYVVRRERRCCWPLMLSADGLFIMYRCIWPAVDIFVGVAPPLQLKIVSTRSRRIEDGNVAVASDCLLPRHDHISRRSQRQPKLNCPLYPVSELDRS